MNENLAPKVKFLEDKFQQLIIEINSINENVNLFKRLIQELADKYQDVDLLKSLNNKFDSSVKAFESNCHALKCQKDSLADDLSKLKSNLSSLVFDHVDLGQRFDDHFIKSEAERNNKNAKIAEIECGFNNQIQALRNEMKASLSKLQSDLSVSPASVFEQNNNIIKKLESASLDGTNAMLKVNNMDMNIRIVEKKIENLDIRIKKIELLAQ